MIFEGRDGAGKDGAIKRIIAHLSPRNTRVAALPKPSDREQGEWYFQRYVRYLPSAGEWVLFNRSWYNRAGVEVVMGFSTLAEQEQFLLDAPVLRTRSLTQSGVTLVIKYWLDVSRDEQQERLQERRTDPLKKLKTGPDGRGGPKSGFRAPIPPARNDMLTRTHTPVAPWICVRSDHHEARATEHACAAQAERHGAGPGMMPPKVDDPDPQVLFPFEAEALHTTGVWLR